jgi:heme/copper-type cytochrome/quinol oxidase subunit 3
LPQAEDEQVDVVVAALPTSRSYGLHGWIAVVVVTIGMAWLVVSMYRDRTVTKSTEAGPRRAHPLAQAMASPGGFGNGTSLLLAVVSFAFGMYGLAVGDVRGLSAGLGLTVLFGALYGSRRLARRRLR